MPVQTPRLPGGWVALGVVALSAWALVRYAEGETPRQILAAVPWVWIVIVGVSLLALRWFFSRSLPLDLDPEAKEVLEQIARERANCRHCTAVLKAHSITCGVCGRVVDWASLAGAFIGVALFLGLILRGLYRLGF